MSTATQVMNYSYTILATLITFYSYTVAPAGIILLILRFTTKDTVKQKKFSKWAINIFAGFAILVVLLLLHPVLQLVGGILGFFTISL
jgi:hypothetical protein